LKGKERKEDISLSYEKEALPLPKLAEKGEKKKKGRNPRQPLRSVQKRKGRREQCIGST